MLFNVIFACDKNYGIGRENKIPWDIPEDMEYFRKQTINGTVIMGRKTFESIGNPLPKRTNIVLSNTLSKETEKDKKIVVMRSFEEALKYCETNDLQNIWVIGGAKLYNHAMRHPRCNEIHMTHINNCYHCDTFVNDPRKFKDSFIIEQKLLCTLGISVIFFVLKKVNIEERQYIETLEKIIFEGIKKTDRTGTGTLSIFGSQFKFDLSRSFPLFTTKKMNLRGIFEELMWVLRGDSDSKILREKGVKIWDGNTSRDFLDKRGLTEYQEGWIGPTYGWSMRHLGAPYRPDLAFKERGGFDQLEYVLNLIRTKPESRRIIIDLWDSHLSDQMALTPCMMVYNFFCDTTNKKLNLQMYIRSSDTLLGLPWNIAYAGLLVYLICALEDVDFTPGQLIVTTNDQHLYLDHIPQAKEIVSRAPYLFPMLDVAPKNCITDFVFEDLKLRDYNHRPSVKAKMAV